MAGRFNNLVHQSQCRPCSPGTAVASTGSTQCFACPTGQVASNYGMRRCLNCPEQSDSDLERRVCLCKPGFYLPFYKQDSIYTCIPCPPGADCSAAGNTYFNLRSEVGWWRSSNSSLNFYRCPIRAQCLSSLPQGGSATYTGGFAQVEDTGPEDETRSAAARGASELEVLRRTRRLVEGDAAISVPVDVCGPPYFRCATKCQSNRAAALCTQCLPNYRESVSGDCSLCPKGNNVVAVVFIVIGILIAVYENKRTRAPAADTSPRQRVNCFSLILRSCASLCVHAVGSCSGSSSVPVATRWCSTWPRCTRAARATT